MYLALGCQLSSEGRHKLFQDTKPLPYRRDSTSAWPSLNLTQLHGRCSILVSYRLV